MDDAFMQQCQQRVAQRMEEAIRQWQEPAMSGEQSEVPSAADPAADPSTERLAQAVRYSCLGGGKRLRPLLCYAAAIATGGRLEHADAPAAAVEFMHCYSLVHDDLPAMDDDDLRRGRPTLHRAFDEATAMLAGDIMQATAFRVLTAPAADKMPAAAAETRLNMLQVLSQAAEAMVRGQALDFAATGSTLQEQQLTAIHQLKTGALIRASVLLGALSQTGALSQAGAFSQTGALSQTKAPFNLTALSRYAEHIGLAFQIQDDILDETASTATLGKPQGSDRRAAKPTYVSLLGLDAAKARAESLVNDALTALKDWDSKADRLRHLAAYIVNRPC